jgi:hypothetical protein
VPRQRLAPVEHQRVGQREGDLPLAHQPQLRLAHDLRDAQGGGVGVDGVGRGPLQAEHHGEVAAVALARRPEGAEELGADVLDAVEHPLALERLGEAARGAHRAHRVRARRADADLEHVEDAERHGVMRMGFP